MVTFLIAILVLAFYKTNSATRIPIGASSAIMFGILVAFVWYTWEAKNGASHQWFKKVKTTVQDIPHELLQGFDAASMTDSTASAVGKHNVMEYRSTIADHTSGGAEAEPSAHGAHHTSNVAVPG